MTNIEKIFNDATQGLLNATITVKGLVSTLKTTVDEQVQRLEDWKNNIRVGQTIDLKHLDWDKFYPVLINGSGINKEYRLYKGYSSGNTDGHLAGVDIKFLLSGGSWGGNPMGITLLQNYQTYQQNVGAIGWMGHGYYCGLYLRGGCSYALEGNGSFSFTILEEKTQYRKPDANGKYALTAGPVTLQQCLESVGKISTWEISKDQKQYISTLGA